MPDRNPTGPFSKTLKLSSLLGEAKPVEPQSKHLDCSKKIPPFTALWPFSRVANSRPKKSPWLVKKYSAAQLKSNQSFSTAVYTNYSSLVWPAVSVCWAVGHCQVQILKWPKVRGFFFTAGQIPKFLFITGHDKLTSWQCCKRREWCKTAKMQQNAAESILAGKF